MWYASYHCFDQKWYYSCYYWGSNIFSQLVDGTIIQRNSTQTVFLMRLLYKRKIWLLLMMELSIDRGEETQILNSATQQSNLFSNCKKIYNKSTSYRNFSRYLFILHHRRQTTLCIRFQWCWMVNLELDVLLNQQDIHPF